MKQLVFLFFLFSSFATVAFSKSIDISKPESIKFIYQPNDDRSFVCTHKIENKHSNNWLVTCPYYKSPKVFSVHLLVRKFSKKVKPKTKFEVLYWVTNRIDNVNVPEFTGTTIRLSLFEENWADEFSFSQHVDNGLASLDLTIKFN